MFRFTIRELVLVTLVVAMGAGWWLDHQAQRSAVEYYKSACDHWREKEEAVDGMLTMFGFEISQEGPTKSYAPPPVLRSKLEKSNWPN